jgi:GDPmannose 4,6-dehydratase
MQKTSVIVTGATGQDGIFLTSKFLEENFQVLAITSDIKSPKAGRFERLFPNLNLVEFKDYGNFGNLLQTYKPGIVVNLAAISSVAESFKNPDLCVKVNYEIPSRIAKTLLSEERFHNIRFFQASSSEMFGNSRDGKQNEESELNPLSPYGESKTKAHLELLQLRKNFGLNVSSGILFNHESEYRDRKFVSMKLVTSLIELRKGLIDFIPVGNLDSFRDWGYAKDYADAIFKICADGSPADYVVSSGESYSIREFAMKVIEELGLPDETIERLVMDKNLLRPSDIRTTRGDNSKIHRILNWQPTTTFQELVKIMVSHAANQSVG